MEESIWPTHYHNLTVAGINLFYREAGDPHKSTILLLHGLPSSSHMFRNLIDDLAPHYHVVAPDYPGFGLTTDPSSTTFEYSFDNLADVIEQFIDSLSLNRFYLFMQDYGGPVGFRIMMNRPELIAGLLVQNANAYEDGLGPDVQAISSLIEAQDTKGLDAAIDHMLSLEGIKEQYLYGVKHQERINPDSYLNDFFHMQQGDRRNIQNILFKNYSTNFPRYPEWQRQLRKLKLPTLVTWGKNDKIFTGPGGEAYKRDNPDAEIHLFEGGHFLLEEYHLEVAKLINAFIGKSEKQFSNKLRN